MGLGFKRKGRYDESFFLLCLHVDLASMYDTRFELKGRGVIIMYGNLSATILSLCNELTVTSSLFGEPGGAFVFQLVAIILSFMTSPSHIETSICR